MCRAEISEKVDFMFDLNDFNQQGSLGYDELVVLLFMAASSVVLLRYVCQS